MLSLDPNSIEARRSSVANLDVHVIFKEISKLAYSLRVKLLVRTQMASLKGGLLINKP